VLARTTRSGSTTLFIGPSSSSKPAQEHRHAQRPDLEKFLADGGQGWGVVRRLRYVIKADDADISRNLQTRFVQDTHHPSAIWSLATNTVVTSAPEPIRLPGGRIMAVLVRRTIIDDIGQAEAVRRRFEAAVSSLVDFLIVNWRREEYWQLTYCDTLANLLLLASSGEALPDLR